ncbi:unnamed protein product, partial [Allacma fusca]
IGIDWYKGLLPLPRQEHNESMEGVACNYVVHCKIDPEKNKTTGVLHYCPDANSTKPFFNIHTCECIEEDDFCADNDIPANNKNCITKYIETDEEESCQNFEPNSKTYYIDHFPNLRDPKKFWQCRPQNMTQTTAASFNCSDNNSDRIIWDQNSCQCENIKDETLRNATIKLNSHPANRFNCAHPYMGVSTDVCKDDTGQFYLGKVANRGLDQSLFLECIEDDNIYGTTTPIKNYCDPDQLFDILTCNCTDADDFDPSENFNPEHHKRCATPIVIEDEESCRDESGIYHVGVIPHQKTCSKFWNCGVNRIPTVQSCPDDLVFNVMSTFCGCDHPQLNSCEENLKLENKFLCATNTTSF